MSNIPGTTPTPSSPTGSAQNPQILNEIQTEISNEAAPLLDFLTAHAVKIMMVLGLFVAAVGGLGAYNWHQNSLLEDAQSQLHTIVQTKQGTDRVTALEAFLSEAPQSLHSAVLLHTAEASMAADAFDKAAAAYGQLADLHVDGATSILSSLNQGQALILAGKGTAAVGILEDLVSKVPTEQAIIIQQALAEAALLSGDTAKAKAAFEAMANATIGTESEFYRYRARTVAAYSQEKK